LSRMKSATTCSNEREAPPGKPGASADAEQVANRPHGACLDGESGGQLDRLCIPEANGCSIADETLSAAVKNGINSLWKFRGLVYNARCSKIFGQQRMTCCKPASSSAKGTYAEGDPASGHVRAPASNLTSSIQGPSSVGLTAYIRLGGHMPPRRSV
jgi:hypothetical protein